jgi:hypothetical protein
MAVSGGLPSAVHASSFRLDARHAGGSPNGGVGRRRKANDGERGTRQYLGSTRAAELRWHAARRQTVAGLQQLTKGDCPALDRTDQSCILAGDRPARDIGSLVSGESR